MQDREVNQQDYPVRGLETTLFSNSHILSKTVDIYFKPKFFEKNGGIYPYLGIKQFKKGLLKIMSYLGRKRENETHGTNYYLGTSLSLNSINQFELRTRFNESVHTICALPAVYFFIDGAINANYALEILGAITALPQLYVIGLQRYNRARVHGLLSRMKKRDSRETEKTLSQKL